MTRLLTLCFFFFLLQTVQSEAQTKNDTADLRSAIDSIRDGRGVKLDNRGNIDTGVRIADTVNTKPEIPTPTTPNNPNSHNPTPDPANPSPPLTPGTLNNGQTRTEDQDD